MHLLILLDPSLEGDLFRSGDTFAIVLDLLSISLPSLILVLNPEHPGPWRRRCQNTIHR